MASKFLEELPPARQNDYLDVPGRHIEDVEHAAHPAVVRKHERIIKNNGRRVTLFDQHFRKRESDQDGDLFLGSHAEMMKGFLVSGLSHNPDDVQVFINRDFGTG